VTWLRRLGAWIALALAAIIPAWGWWRERRRRIEADARWRREVEGRQRERQLAADLEAAERRAAGARIAAAAATEREASPPESQAAELRAREVDEDDLEDLAARVGGVVIYRDRP